MQINEMYKMLGITKDNLRYYEKEGLIAPERKANGYRDYSDADVERLKIVLVLRKIGVPVAEIRNVLDNKKELSEVLSQTIKQLDQEISEMQEARKLCTELEKSQLSIDEINPDEYLEKISRKSSGFMDLTKDVLNYSTDLFVDSFGHWQFFFPIFKPLLWKRKKKGSVVLAVIFCALFILGGGNLCSRMNMRVNMKPGFYYLQGMFVNALIVIIWIMLRNVFYFLSKKYQNAEKPIVIIGSIVSALVSFGLVFAAVFHWGHLLMFSPYHGQVVFLNEAADYVNVVSNDEMGYEDNGWQASSKSLNYLSVDVTYNQALKEALLSSESTGVWSTTVNQFTLLDAKSRLGIPEKFYEISFASDENNRSTTFFLIQDTANKWTGLDAEWIVDEPNYGIYKANNELVRLVKEYDQHITLSEGVLFRFQNIFEYDPEKIWKDELYQDGRFDTYRYLTILDRETGEDITERFIEEYKEAYMNQEWDVLLEAFESIQERWDSVYVDPDAAHMEGTGS